jgi:hypothetical protein
MILVVYFSCNATILNLNRNATCVGKVRRVESEDANIASVHLMNDSVRVSIEFIGNNQDC